MDRPPGSLDDLQPQDLTTSSLPSVINLTRKGEECVLDAASLDAITMVSHPGWYQNSSTSNTGLPFPETGPSSIQPGDHIQPDNAFSQTTLTLSYMSRSHVFSTHDSLSGHSSLYSVPSVSKYSLQPSCDSEKGLGETGITLNQHYLDGPIDLAAQTELDNTQQTVEFNGAVISNLETYPDAKEENNSENSESLHNGKGDIWSSSRECPKPLQECPEYSESLPECTYPLRKHSEPLGECFVHEGVQRCPDSLQVCQDILQKSFLECPKTLQKCPATLPECPEPLQDHPKPFRMSPTPSRREHSDSLQEFSKPLPECTKPFQKHPTPDAKKLEDMDSPDVLVLCSTQNPAVVPGNDGARELFSLNRGFISTLEDPMSPTATSLDNVEDVFILPEASSSPSRDNSLLETDEGAFDGLSAQETLQHGSTTEDSTPSLHSHDISKCINKRKAPLEPLIDLTEDVCMTDVLEDNLKGTTVIPLMNGNAKGTLTERKLPVRSSRGMRLEAIVMNINSSRYKVSGCIRTSRKSNTFQKLDKDSKTRVHQNDGLSESKKKSKEKVKPKASPKKGQTNVNPENCKNSTSDSDGLSLKSHSSTVQLEPDNSLQYSPVRSKRKSSSEQTSQLIQENSVDFQPLSQTDNSLEINVVRIPSSLQLSKSPHKNPGKAESKVSSKKARPTAKPKAQKNPKKRRKKLMRGQASNIFSPKEPEIKLKYINYKEEKRDLRIDNFSPFIRVESKESVPSLCTVVNYPKEVCTQPKKSQQQGASGEFISTVVPSTSCLQLGRLSTRGEHQRSLVCCLCGQSANAMDLGDLHGPYYSEGYRPSTETPAGAPGLKEDDSSDSDSSSCSSRGQGRKRLIPPTQWTHNHTHRKSQQWMGENSRSPAAKRVRPDPCGADVEDWYSPPLLPLEPCEYWLHEDCGVWSAGVYLIKGKIYGLEEAVKAAQVMMCSSCHEQGATLGCFFKGCRKKYHYRCALQSDCVLIKDNLSMKCKKHKNKLIAATQNSRWVDR